MDITTILLFFVYLFGLGYTATYWFKKPENKLERWFLYVAMGLGVFPLLAILLNFFHVMLDWRLFLLLSLLFPLYRLIRILISGQLWSAEYLSSLKSSFSWSGFQIKKSDLALAGVLIIFLTSLWIYASGAFNYPYLEDEDPWGHAVGAKYVAVEKTAYDPVFQDANYSQTVDFVLSYIDPYPPAYDVMMGILHQTSPDLNWTLKFFNALIISLGFIFFFLLAKEISNSNKALLATFILACLPAYLSHFIWAHALTITLFFPTMYAFIKIKEDKRWAFLAAVLLGSVWVSQSIEQPLKITSLILIFLVVGSICQRRWLKHETYALVGGIGLSFFWWGAMIQKYTLRGIISYFTDATISKSALGASIGAGSPGITLDYLFQKAFSILKSMTSAGGSASRPYNFNDFFFAKTTNMINAPIGIGVVVSILTLVGVVYLIWRYRAALVSADNTWKAVILFWLIFGFWAVNGQTFPISIARGPFRSWVWLAMAASLVAVEGFYFTKSLFSQKMVKFLVVAVLLFLIIFTSGQPKYAANTAKDWPTSGSFSNMEEPVEYANWFNSVPLNTKVFLYAPRDKVVLGLGGYSCLWCEDVLSFRDVILDQNVSVFYSFLKSQDYEYVILNGNMDSKYFKSKFGENKTNELLPKRYEEIFNSGKFMLVHKNDKGLLVLKVR